LNSNNGRARAKEDIMLRHRGGERVKSGFYFNLETWEVTTLSGTGGVLGGRGAQFLRVPTLALLALAPLMGLAYAMFLPFIGIAMVVSHFSKQAGRAAKSAFTGVLTATSPAMRPGEAYFGGERPSGRTAEGEPEPSVEQRLKEIEDEVARREKR
jgi:hypothetical protein